MCEVQWVFPLFSMFKVLCQSEVIVVSFWLVIVRSVRLAIRGPAIITCRGATRTLFSDPSRRSCRESSPSPPSNHAGLLLVSIAVHSLCTSHDAHARARATLPIRIVNKLLPDHRRSINNHQLSFHHNQQKCLLPPHDSKRSGMLPTCTQHQQRHALTDMSSF